ncbi:uncharacterized protein [Nicotiana tomentosiformis]|uniref:uncharacterized protein n=1 Tax=Nicotiana tomentosiformis TaxID=4098 RepID=UPI00388C3AC3
MWQMRCTKWNPWWKPSEETLVAITWISFHDLPPNLFGKEFVFSLAREVGRPLHVDLATQNGTRPSCANVKVEVNLLSNIPQRIKIEEEEDESGPEKFKWIKIRYDYMLKYCKSCKKQGHKEEECWVINPELRQFEDQGNDKKNEQEVIGTAAASTKVLTSGKVVGKLIANPSTHEWMKERKNKYQHDKRGYIIDNTKEKEPNNGKGKAKVEAVTTKNKFNALELEEIAPPTLRITDGKGDNSSNEQHKKQQGDKYKKDQEKEQ